MLSRPINRSSRFRLIHMPVGHDWLVPGITPLGNIHHRSQESRPTALTLREPNETFFLYYYPCYRLIHACNDLGRPGPAASSNVSPPRASRLILAGKIGPSYAGGEAGMPTSN